VAPDDLDEQELAETREEGICPSAQRHRFRERELHELLEQAVVRGEARHVDHPGRVERSGLKERASQPRKPQMTFARSPPPALLATGRTATHSNLVADGGERRDPGP